MKYFLLLLAVAASVHATEVRPCQQGVKFAEDDVKITNCAVPPCRLRQKSKVGVEIKLKPAENIKSLTTNVFAVVFGVPLPFVGVDGTDACGNIYNADGTTKVGCPLRAGEEYVYKNAFDVLNSYPRIKVDVSWSLSDGSIFNEKVYHCFKIQSRITS
ncbi:Hypothetical predicted protein [Cloeon dipterum]|uniref:MD-2-related lipid-recognition domain-containing protein n=1 Tax=Cloeon dipterum TaxID=197152 RepID=A0A8S1CS85_9INSE|nr:Hypothetical predicted protein [Cloeon dipterum]